MFLLDYDGTLLAQSSIDPRPTPEVIQLLQTLTADPRNTVFIVSGRGRRDLTSWFGDVVRPPPARRAHVTQGV